MKKNKKITFIALLISLCALASAFALAACNGGKQPEEPHVHQYSEEWTSDETYHWHKAICEHTDLRTAPEMHVDDDFDDICDVCHSPIAHEHLAVRSPRFRDPRAPRFRRRRICCNL